MGVKWGERNPGRSDEMGRGRVREQPFNNIGGIVMETKTV